MSVVASPPGDGAFSVVVGVVHGDGGSMMELLVLLTNFGEVFFVVWSVRFVSLRFAIGWDLSSGFSSSAKMALDRGSSFLAELVASFPCQRWKGSVEARSASSIRRRGGSAAMSHAAPSKVWSFFSVLACGSCSEASVPRVALRLVAERRHGGRRRRGPELKKNGGLGCVLCVFYVSLRGLRVTWVCTVLFCAI